MVRPRPAKGGCLADGVTYSKLMQPQPKRRPQCFSNYSRITKVLFHRCRDRYEPHLEADRVRLTVKQSPAGPICMLLLRLKDFRPSGIMIETGTMLP